jgi:hypothetical protein
VYSLGLAVDRSPKRQFSLAETLMRAGLLSTIPWLESVNGTMKTVRALAQGEGCWKMSDRKLESRSGDRLRKTRKLSTYVEQVEVQELVGIAVVQRASDGVHDSVLDTSS